MLHRPGADRGGRVRVVPELTGCGGHRADRVPVCDDLCLHEFGKAALARLTGQTVTLQTWGALLDEVLDQMLAQRKIFLMHERNQAALEKLHRKDHDDEHDDIQQRFRQALADPSLSLSDRVRMACSLGAVFGGLFLAGDAFDNVSSAELGSLIRDAIHDVVARPAPT